MYMPTKKKQHLKRSHKKQHVKRSHKKQHRRYPRSSYIFRGGTCSACGSCMQSSPALFSGGNQTIYTNRSGGNDNLPSYNGLPLRYVYGENTYNQDPSDPQHTTPSRLLSSGGKPRCNKNKTKKGGAMGFSYLNGQLGTSLGFNPVSMISESSGASLHTNIISGSVSSNALQNPSVFTQPVDTKYNIYNKPIA